MANKKKNKIVSDDKFEYYIIEEYQSRWDRWVQIVDNYYLKEYEFGQNTACGDCWQTTGFNGMFDKKYAKEYLKKLNEALNNGTIKEKVAKAEVTRFRLCKVKYHKEVTFVK